MHTYVKCNICRYRVISGRCRLVLWYLINHLRKSAFGIIRVTVQFKQILFREFHLRLLKYICTEKLTQYMCILYICILKTDARKFVVHSTVLLLCLLRINVHQSLCRLEIGDFWPPPSPTLSSFYWIKSTIFDPLNPQPLPRRHGLWMASIAYTLLLSDSEWQKR